MFTLELRNTEINTSASASSVYLAKTKAKMYLLTYTTALSVRRLMSRNGKAWRFKHALLQNEEPCGIFYLIQLKPQKEYAYVT